MSVWPSRRPGFPWEVGSLRGPSGSLHGDTSVRAADIASLRRGRVGGAPSELLRGLMRGAEQRAGASRQRDLRVPAQRGACSRLETRHGSFGVRVERSSDSPLGAKRRPTRLCLRVGMRRAADRSSERVRLVDGPLRGSSVGSGAQAEPPRRPILNPQRFRRTESAATPGLSAERSGRSPVLRDRRWHRGPSGARQSRQLCLPRLSGLRNAQWLNRPGCRVRPLTPRAQRGRHATCRSRSPWEHRLARGGNAAGAARTLRWNEALWPRTTPTSWQHGGRRSNGERADHLVHAGDRGDR